MARMLPSISGKGSTAACSAALAASPVNFRDSIAEAFQAAQAASRPKAAWLLADTAALAATMAASAAALAALAASSAA